MKLLLTTTTGLMLAMAASAQDIIIKRNGDELEAKVQKVSDTEIEYKKWSNLNGPVYTLKTKDVFMVKYKNGEKEMFEASQTTEAQTETKAEAGNTEPGTPIAMQPVEGNDSLIALYNNEKHAFKPNIPRRRELREWFGTLGVTANSVLSSSDIEISIETASPEQDLDTGYQQPGEIYYAYGSDNGQRGKFVIKISNKLDQTIYIDKANCYRILDNGEYMSYYNTTETTISKNSSNGGGMNLGAVTNALGVGGVAGALANGINVGGSKSTSYSTTYNDDRFVAIPAKGHLILSQDKLVKIKEYTGWTMGKVIILSRSEHFWHTNIYPLDLGETRTFGESDTPGKQKFIIQYSTDAYLKDIRTQQFEVYIKDAFCHNSHRKRSDPVVYQDVFSSYTRHTIIVRGPSHQTQTATTEETE